jgi:hypothetical protein
VLSPDLRSEAMERFIRRENLALFRKRLAEAPDDATRQILLRLLAEEDAKDPELRKPRGLGKSPHAP